MEHLTFYLKMLRRKIDQFFCRHSWAYFEREKLLENGSRELIFWKQCPYCLKHVNMEMHEYLDSISKDHD